jgi:hypothetical protein
MDWQFWVAVTILTVVLVPSVWVFVEALVKSLRSYDKTFAVFCGAFAVIVVCMWAVHVVIDRLYH